MENWATQITKTIDTKTEGIRDKEIIFFRIAEFKRNITRIDSFSKSCSACQQQKTHISDAVNKIDDALNYPGRTRRKYDRLISKLSKHMQKEHGFYAPYYFSYTYSAIGIAMGLIIGFILFKIYPELWVEMFSIGFTVGLIPSYILGFAKDKKIRSEKKLM
jgi:hypothetical protein